MNCTKRYLLYYKPAPRNYIFNQPITSPTKQLNIMQVLQNLHILKVSYLGATDTKPSRIKIQSDRFKQSVIISYDYDFNNTSEIAQDWLTKNGFELVGKGEGPANYDYILSTTFEPLKK